MSKMLIALVLTLMLTGCITTYEVVRTDPQGVSTTLKVRSVREFPGGIRVDYQRDAGEFHLEAGEVSNDEQLTQLLLAILPRLALP